MTRRSETPAGLRPDAGQDFCKVHVHAAPGTLPTLIGHRLVLRQLAPDDLPALLRIFGDPEVAKYLGIARLRDAADAEQLLAGIDTGLQQRTLFQWGLADAVSGAVWGTCTLSDLRWSDQRGEVGFALGRAHWGAGLMSEALPLLIAHAFGPLELHRLEADVDPRNTRSIRLLEKLGFRREGLLRQRHVVDGERQDSLLLGLLAGEYS